VGLRVGAGHIEAVPVLVDSADLGYQALHPTCQFAGTATDIEGPPTADRHGAEDQVLVMEVVVPLRGRARHGVMLARGPALESRGSARLGHFSANTSLAISATASSSCGAGMACE
jgi:hypothetical protein